GPEGPAGPAGPTGDPGQSVTGATLALGSSGCPFGGSQFTSANGITYACNGEPGVIGAQGPAGVSVTGTTLAAGDANCPFGGTEFTSAIGTTYACNGVTGPQGSQGPAGEVGAAGPTGPMGLTGPAGPVGAAGPQGATGAVGPTGPVGPVGPVGAAGPQGATGAVGPMGPQGPQGSQGPQGPQGVQGPIGLTGPTGATGAVGPAGPAGPSDEVTDSAGQVLGHLVASSNKGVTVVTSAHYQVTIGWDGVVAPAQIWWSTAGCTGTAYLNAGNSAKTLTAKTVVRSAKASALYIPSGTPTNGYFTATTISQVAVENPGCLTFSIPGNTFYGWQLTATTATAVGLPTTITPPLVLP
ncbi:MAG: hypothetical protein HY901_24870, partial [Deltaproteobacteria bacterium]|nr:hypothetical protein [Deltaproteobacteria bacterium]